MLCASVLLIFLVCCQGIASAADEFGAPSHGLQCRLVPVPTTVDDRTPDASKAISEFADGEQLTFAVELKNVSQEALKIHGVQYGKNYGAAKGRLNTDFVGPLLFDLQFTDEDGKPLTRAERFHVSDILSLTGASEHELKPDESLTVILRPAKFREPTNFVLPAGRYHVTVRYHFEQPEPDKPGRRKSDCWAHEVTSNRVSFAIVEDANSLFMHELVWGPENNGLQAAIELAKPNYVVEDPQTAPGVPVKTSLSVAFHVKNVSDELITFVSETHRQDDTAHVVNANGKVIATKGTWFSGWPVDVRWNLKPGEIAKLSVLSPAINSITEPGEYEVRYSVRFNGRIMKDGDGNQIFPAKGDWQDVLQTGEIDLFLRTRTIEDDDRAKPPNFVGKVRFVGPDGESIEQGSFTYRGQIKNKYHENRLIKAGTIQIPDCTTQAAFISVNAPGYQETNFQYVELSPGKVKTLQLKAALPARFSLTRGDGTAVTDAKVRHFNASFAKASSSGLPLKGVQGSVWATSDKEGRVHLTSLQTRDVKRKELGDKLYYFYVEPTDEDLAPIFVGPIKAGQNLGAFKMGPLLEVHGEVHGTAKELKQFSAEWDQPFEQTNDNPKGTFVYADSKRLKTQRDGDKLTFRLTNLRSGTLRIISNFGKRPHKTSHVYSRREVGRKRRADHRRIKRRSDQGGYQSEVVITDPFAVTASAAIGHRSNSA